MADDKKPKSDLSHLPRRGLFVEVRPASREEVIEKLCAAVDRGAEIGVSPSLKGKRGPKKGTGGRPRKEGAVSTRTMYRRKKEGK